MSWKRRRARWRKLPTPSEHGLGFGVQRGMGTVSKVPKIPGGPELLVSASGEVHEIRPWSLWKWVAILTVGGISAVLVFPFLFTWLFWLALGGFLAVLTYRTWRK